MSFKDWESFNDDRIKLPIGGRLYELPEMPAKLGHLLRLAEAGKPVPQFQNSKPGDEERMFLGEDLYQRMVDDGLSEAAIARAVIVAITDWKLGREAAEAAWEAGIDPEALAASLAAKMQQTESTSMGEATTTPQPDSTSGTSSPKATRPASRKRKAPAKKAASPGPTSPNSGD